MGNIIVFITAPTEEEAAAMAKTLVQERLAACVNIVSGIRSFYRWEGRIEDDSEVLMIAKSREELFERLSGRVKELHSYTVPEVIAAPITRGSADYLGWLRQELGE